MNPLRVLLMLIPFLAVFMLTNDFYNKGFYKIITEYGDQVTVWTSYTHQTFQKDVIEGKRSDAAFEKFMPAFSKSNYEAMVALAQSQQKAYRNAFYLFAVIDAAFGGFVAYVYFRNRFKYENGELHLGAPKHTTIPVTSVRSFFITTLTPLIPSRQEISQINWRDEVDIELDKGNSLNVSLFEFPGFKKILQKMLEDNPNIQVSFTKRTIAQNMEEYT